MATIKFLQKRRPDREGKCPVYIAIYDRDQVDLIYTKEQLHPNHWDKKNQCVRSLKNLPAQVSEVFATVQTMKAEVEACRAELKRKQGIEPSGFAIKAEYERKRQKRADKQRIKETASKENERAVTALMSKWVDSLQRQPLTIKTIKDSLNTFKDYLKATSQLGIEVKEIDLSLINDYSRWLTEKRKLADSSHGKRMKHLRQFLGTLKLTFDPSKIEIRNHTRPIIHLTLPELKMLETVDVSNSKLMQGAKDMFLLGCYTGLRISDLKRITPSAIQRDRIEITTKKTGEHLTIPILPETRAILSRYNDYSPAISEPVLNKNIKEVCKQAGIISKVKITTKRGDLKKDIEFHKYELISSHVAGKTFISLAPERWKMVPHEIAAITGKSIHTLLSHYFKNNREAAIKKMVGESTLRIAN